MERLALWMLFAAAVVFDCRSSQIPNWLCLGGGAAGLLVLWARLGIAGVMGGIAGMALAVGILLPFWRLNILGGGDVKLMMASGCWLGTDVWKLLEVSALCSAVYAVGLLAVRRNFRKRLAVFLGYARQCMGSGIRGAYPFHHSRTEDASEGGMHVSYGIFAGFLIGCMRGYF